MKMNIANLRWRPSRVTNGILLLVAIALAGCREPAATGSGASAAGDHGGRGAGLPAQVPSVKVMEIGEQEADRRPGFEILADPNRDLLALDAEEAAWLDRHGYPTPREITNVMSMDAKELETAMRRRGDMKSAALLGHRYLATGDLAGAERAFTTGAFLGSLHAMQQAAIVKARRTTGFPEANLGEAGVEVMGPMLAKLQMARMLGDHRADALIERHGREFDWRRHTRRTLEVTARYMDRYGAVARAAGRRVEGPDPRPNRREWTQISENPAQAVKIYGRGDTSP